ncbi:MAG: copper resistance protein CopB [Robiginitomaculum sp.]|nr:MAG: copper resistance protein CopB [Robiginitomaculum sp.]
MHKVEKIEIVTKTKSSKKPYKPWSMADEYYGEEAMAEARALEIATLGGAKTSFIIADRLESQIASGENAFVWDAQGWYGTDENKLWIKTEGEYSFGSDEIEDAEIQALWSKPISAFWDVQAGVRYDLAPKGRTHAVIGIQGLAPYWFEVDAALFLSNKGDLTSSIEAEYELLLSQRLVLQPRGEIGFSAQDIPELGTGAGFTNLDLGLRLRYEIKREFSPYVGVEWQRNLGETAQFTKDNGGDPDKVVILFGVRAWY